MVIRTDIVAVSFTKEQRRFSDGYPLPRIQSYIVALSYKPG